VWEEWKMSGIYIPGMALPAEPGAHKIRLFVREDGTASIWGLEEYIPHEPLEVIPVPDHGDLIERDALVAAYDAEHVGPPGRARELMMEAPAIIPAEEEET
jgi:hypothetical protein